jgi:hypothetical protein
MFDGRFPIKPTEDILVMLGVEYLVKNGYDYHWDANKYGQIINWSDTCKMTGQVRRYEIRPTYTDICTVPFKSKTEIDNAYAIDVLYYEEELSKSLQKRLRILNEINNYGESSLLTLKLNRIENYLDVLQEYDNPN